MFFKGYNQLQVKGFIPPKSKKQKRKMKAFSFLTTRPGRAPHALQYAPNVAQAQISQ